MPRKRSVRYLKNMPMRNFVSRGVGALCLLVIGRFARWCFILLRWVYCCLKLFRIVV